MKKILGIVVLLVIGAVGAVFVTEKSDYAYVRSLAVTDCSNAPLVSRDTESHKVISCIFAFEKPTARLIRIASKKANSVFGMVGVMTPKDVDAGVVFVGVIPDDELEGDAAERGCNYKLIYLPEGKDYTYISDGVSGDIKSVELCKKIKSQGKE